MKTSALAVSAILFLTPLLVACTSTSSADNAQKAVNAANYEGEKNYFRQRVRDGVIPKDYKTQIDAIFARTLRDPESRKVRFKPQKPSSQWKGLVCGYTNAKNGFGGYTGEKIFAATFDSSGHLFYMKTFGEGDSDLSVEEGQILVMAFDC